MTMQCELTIGELSNGLSFRKQFLQTFKIWYRKWDFKNPLTPLWGLICSIVVSTLLHMEINLSVTFLHPGGHSSTTWTKFDPILTTYPTRVDVCGDFTYYLPFVHVTRRRPSFEHLPTSSSPRSLWTTPCRVEISQVFLLENKMQRASRDSTLYHYFKSGSYEIP